MSLRGLLKGKAEVRRGYLKSRSGRRPMSVDTLLRKEKDGSLLKTSEAEDPTENKDGFKLQGRVNFQGLPIAIENDKGSVRSGKSADGTSWSTKMKTPYGYIEGTKGADGDEIDAYVGPDKHAPKAFVIHQAKPDGTYDEDKVMLGYQSAAAARKDILRHHDDPTLFKSITTLAIKNLRDRILEGKQVDKIAARVDYREGDDPQTTGMPAFAPRGKKQLPSREEMDLNPTPKVESRQENRGTVLSDQYTQASGTDDVGKYASGYSKAERAAELIGLGTIAAGPASDMLARHRARKAGKDPSTMSEHSLDKYQVLKHEHHAPADLAGLGILAAPYASNRWGKLLAKHGAAVSDGGGALSGSIMSPQQRGWDKISRENVGSAGPEKHSLQPTYTSLSDISTSVGQDESKTSSAHVSLMRALNKLAQVHPSNGLPPRKQTDHKDGLAYGDSMYDIPAGVAVSDGLSKSAAMALDLDLIREETFAKLADTQESLDKLKKLEDTRPHAGEVVRGALVGGAVGPLADIANRAMSGAEGRSGKPILLRGSTGKLLARPHMARAAQGAVLGGLVPVGRHFLERESAKQKLREAVGQSDPDALRSGIKRTIGL